MRAVDVIIEDIKQNPNNWTIDAYRLTNKVNKIDIWIANGLLFYQVEGLPPIFSLWDKVKFYFFMESENSFLQEKIINKFKEATDATD